MRGMVVGEGGRSTGVLLYYKYFFFNSYLLLVNVGLIFCRYIFVDCKIDGGKQLCLSRRASGAFRLLNITVYEPMAPNYLCWLLEKNI